jgi:peptidoglycan/LPS O-acetylase OafA/YrhL
VLGVATLASWTAALVLLGTGSGVERVYLGTDTRLGAITLGAFAGYLTTQPRWLERLQRWAVPAAPVAALIVAALFVLLDGDVDWSAQRWVLVLGFEVAVSSCSSPPSARAAG